MVSSATSLGLIRTSSLSESPILDLLPKHSLKIIPNCTRNHIISLYVYTPIPNIVVRAESNKQEADDCKGLWESPN